MKVRLTYLEGESKIDKRFVGISEVEIRQGMLELWTRNDEGQAKIEFSISVNLILSMVTFKHIIEKNNKKVKERKSRVKKNLNRYSRLIKK